MPPYWSLGFQLCRYGYNSLAKVKETVERMRKFDIPQDVQYGDIDYMDRQLDFTINPKTYNGLPDYVRELKKSGIRYITILVRFLLFLYRRGINFLLKLTRGLLLGRNWYI